MQAGGVLLDSCLQLRHAKLVFILTFWTCHRKFLGYFQIISVHFLRCRYAFPLRPFWLWPKDKQSSVIKNSFLCTRLLLHHCVWVGCSETGTREGLCPYCFQLLFWNLSNRLTPFRFLVSCHYCTWYCVSARWMKNHIVGSNLKWVVTKHWISCLKPARQNKIVRLKLLRSGK